MAVRRIGRGTRLTIGLQVSLAVALAAGAAVLAIDLAERSYLRVDLSASGRNTLDPALAELVERLPERARVDVFFRPLVQPYDGLTAEIHARVLGMLFTAQSARRDKLEVEVHDTDSGESKARQAELGVEGTNILVVSCGERRRTVDLFQEVAGIDWGNPTPRLLRYLTGLGILDVVNPATYDPQGYEPARLVSFRGQEALAQALLEVSSGRAARVLFSEGHGEGDLFGTLSADLNRLRVALERDGFEVASWNAAREGPVPDADVLALIGARQPFTPEELGFVRDFVAGGGRVLAAPSFEEVEQGIEGGIAELLHGYGMVVEPGVVCVARKDRLGRRIEGIAECAELVIEGSGLSPSHPLTEALRRRGRRMRFVLTHSFRRGGVGRGGILLDIIHSPQESWRDLANEQGAHDFRLDPEREESGRFRLVMQAQLTVARGDAGAAPREGRVLGVASANVFTNGSFDANRDFLVNAFDWMAERAQLVPVAPRPPGESVLAIPGGAAPPLLSLLVLAVLPGSLGLAGLFVAWRRRR